MSFCAKRNVNMKIKLQLLLFMLPYIKVHVPLIYHCSVSKSHTLDDKMSLFYIHCHRSFNVASISIAL